MVWGADCILHIVRLIETRRSISEMQEDIEAFMICFRCLQMKKSQLCCSLALLSEHWIQLKSQSNGKRCRRRRRRIGKYLRDTVSWKQICLYVVLQHDTMNDSVWSWFDSIDRDCVKCFARSDFGNENRRLISKKKETPAISSDSTSRMKLVLGEWGLVCYMRAYRLHQSSNQAINSPIQNNLTFIFVYISLWFFWTGEKRKCRTQKAPRHFVRCEKLKRTHLSKTPEFFSIKSNRRRKDAHNTSTSLTI